jgi:hypothetical protein
LKVVLEAGVFTKVGLGELGALCLLGLQGQHRIEVEDMESAQVRECLARLDSDFREDWELALDNGPRLGAQAFSGYAIRVADIETSDWKSDDPRLTLEDALRVLREPFQVLLEDDVSDRAFLLSMTDGDQRVYLEERERKGFLVFTHAGGIGKMLALVERRKARESSFGRLWLLFDSDKLQPEKPSPVALKIGEVCGDLIPHHMLARRSIENYLPLSALKSWTSRAPSGKRRERGATFKAFTNMSDEQQHCFNMKEGLDGDNKRKGATAGDLYKNLSKGDQQKLAGGFGRKIGRLFGNNLVTREDLRRNGWAELNPEVAKLIRYTQ